MRVRSRSPDALRFLALGDSYSIGEGVAPDGCWPVQLARALHGEGIALDDPDIIATTGWTTDELDAAIDAAEPASDFDLVSLLIGVNNQYRGRDVDNYRKEFAALLERAIGFDEHAFALEMLETEDVLIVPGSSFNVPYRNHFRVTLLPQAEVLREVFARIERVLSRRAASGATRAAAVA